MISIWLVILSLIFGVAVTVMIYVYLAHSKEGPEKSSETEPTLWIWRGKLFFLSFDLLLVSIAAVLLIHRSLFPIMSVPALLFLTPLLGFSLIRLTRLSKSLTGLELLAFSFIVGYIFSGLLYVVLILIEPSIRISVLAVSYLLVGLASAAVQLFGKVRHNGLRSFSTEFDPLVVFGSVFFYLTFFAIMYPQIAMLANSDATRFLAGWSYGLANGLETSLDPSYLLFTAHLAGLRTILEQQNTVLLSSVVLVNLVLPVLFYIAAKRLLVGVDRRLPALATISWVFFSGLGWLYFLVDPPVFYSTLPEYFNVLFDKTYGEAIAFPTEFQFFIPRTVAMGLLLASLSLLGHPKGDSRRIYPLLFLFVLSMYLTHVVEAVLFVLLVVMLAAFSRTENLRLKEALLSSLLAFSLVPAFYFAASPVLNLSLRQSQVLSLIIPAVLIITVLGLRRKESVISRLESVSELLLAKSLRLIIPVMVVFYLVATYVWYLNLPTFRASLYGSSQSLGLVPWYMYPILLGVTGLLAIISFRVLLTNGRKGAGVSLFGAMLALSLFLGWSVSVINANVLFTGIFERRLITFTHLAAAMIAPIPLLSLSSWLRGQTRFSARKFGAMGLIALVVIFGASSSFAKLWYWQIAPEQVGIFPTARELGDSESLGEILRSYDRPSLITFSRASRQTSVFTGIISAVNIVDNPLFLAESPEMALGILGLQGEQSTPFLYLHKRDSNILSQYSRSYLVSTLLPSSQVVFRNDELVVRRLPSLSPPHQSSSTSLVLPALGLDPASPYFLSYRLLSEGGYDYTTTLPWERPSSSSKVLILPLDPPTTTLNRSSLRFDGQGYVDISDSRTLDMEESVTLEAWIKIDANDTAFHNVISKGGPQSVRNYNLYVRDSDGDGTFQLHLSFDSDAGSRGSVTDEVLRRGVWYHIITIISTADQGSNLYYLNGKMIQKVDNLGFSRLIPNDGPLYIGSADNHFIGALRQVRIYDRPLTEGEVGINYVGNGIRDSSLVLEYDFGDRPQFAFDLSGNGNVGRFIDLSFVSSEGRAEDLDQFQMYMDYLTGGGKIVVLNTDGFGGFSKMLFSGEGSTLEADGMSGGGTVIDLGSRVDVPLLRTQSGVDILGTYQTSSPLQTPYAVSMRIGKGELIYINLFPIIGLIVSSGDFGLALPDLLNSAEIRKGQTHNFDIDARFRTASLSGDVRIESTAISSVVGAQTFNLTTSRMGRQDLYTNVMSIIINSDVPVQIRSSSVVLEGGNGFYVISKLGHQVQINLPEKAMLTLTSLNWTISTDGIETATITSLDGLTLLVRTPKIHVIGDASISDLILFRPLGTQSLAESPVLHVAGELEFHIVYADELMVADVFEATGNLVRDPPLIPDSGGFRVSGAVLLILVGVVTLGLTRFGSRLERAIWGGNFGGGDQLQRNQER